MRLLLFLAVFAPCGILQASDPWGLFSPPEDTRIRFRTGIVIRSIEADFQLATPAAVPQALEMTRRDGQDDPGFFTGGLGTVDYDNGFVGPNRLRDHPGLNPGTSPRVSEQGIPKRTTLLADRVECPGQQGRVRGRRSCWAGFSRRPVRSTFRAPRHGRWRPFSRMRREERCWG